MGHGPTAQKGRLLKNGGRKAGILACPTRRADIPVCRSRRADIPVCRSRKADIPVCRRPADSPAQALVELVEIDLAEAIFQPGKQFRHTANRHDDCRSPNLCQDRQPASPYWPVWRVRGGRTFLSADSRAGTQGRTQDRMDRIKQDEGCRRYM